MPRSAIVEQPAAPETLEIIKEEQGSPPLSTVVTDRMSGTSGGEAESVHISSDIFNDKCPCIDDAWTRINEQNKTIDPAVIEKVLADKETELRKEFHETLTKEIAHLIEKFDYILHSEQVRASFMLREAYRDRQEKIKVLQSQLECKNMAGLMYVLCTEKRKSKMEKKKLVEQYTMYIEYLENVLADGQQTILKLSRGYKTASRLDAEWREKIQSIVGEFQNFVKHYMQDTIDPCQYFVEIPKLIESQTHKEEIPDETPIDEKVPIPVKESEYWWEKLEGDARPFVVIGDMADFNVPQRRHVLKIVKANRTATAPDKWKEYVFNEMFQKSGCIHAKAIKDVYAQKLPSPKQWECQGVQTVDDGVERTPSQDWLSRRATNSFDMKGAMGSIVKLITASGLNHAENKATLLGARDSMEIVSTTKLREMEEKRQQSIETIQTLDKLTIGRRRTSYFEERKYFESTFKDVGGTDSMFRQVPGMRISDNESLSENVIRLEHNNSLDVLPRRTHKSRQVVEDKVGFPMIMKESLLKVCPMEMCRRMRMGSFMHSLPAYMKVKHLTHIEQTFEDYQTCTQEQLEVLETRIQEKKAKEKLDRDILGDDPLMEWMNGGVGTQISNSTLSDIFPPCTCSFADDSSSEGMNTKMADLIPVKLNIEDVAKECLHGDDDIKLDWAKVTGHGSQASQKLEPIEFTSNNIYKIRKILKQHPSLCSLLQGNTTF